ADEIGELGELAIRLSGMEGYKHVILLSPGFDSTVLHGIRTSRNMGDVRNGPVTNLNTLNRQTMSTLAFSPNARLFTEMRYMTQKFAKAGVFLAAIDTAGLRPGQVLFDNESLYALPRDTGGSVVDRRNDLGNSLQLLIDRQRVLYVLAFVPPKNDR